MKLNSSTKVWKLAKDLGIKPSADPVSDILAFCEKRVKNFLKDFPGCNTLSELLEWVAGRLNTSFEEIHCNDDLENIKSKYISLGEKVFAGLETWLSSDVFGITIKKTNADPWERQYVSIIDCRGDKRRKAYYTKWHELGHLLILTDQMRLTFQRTLHFSEKDPEEVIVDLIAGKFGFYSPLIKPHFRNELSFDEINYLKEFLCPDASYQSSLIGFVSAWSKPCLLLMCRSALKKSQETQIFQQEFFFDKKPIPVLRAVNITVNEAAREIGLTIHKNMRVPELSIIHAVNRGELEYGEADEDLSWWVSSDGTILPKRHVVVKATQLGNDVYAIISPR